MGCKIIRKAVGLGIRMKYARIEPEVWECAKRAYLEGVPIARVADKHGLKLATLKSKIAREQWNAERTKGRGVTPSQNGNANHSQVQQSRVSGENATLSRLPREARLAALAGVDPAAYQETLATILEELAAEGIGEMEPPRSPGELARVNDAIRKARRMDVKAGAPAGFVRPLRTLTRQPALELDITPADPLADFPI